MKWADYLIPAVKNPTKYDTLGKAIVMYDGEPEFVLPATTKIVIIGAPEDRFTEGAGEIKSPGIIRKYLYSLAEGSKDTVVDMGNLKTGKSLVDTYYCVRDLVSEFYDRNIVTLLLGGSIDVFYGNCLAMKKQGSVITTVVPRLRLPVRNGDAIHPLNSLIFDKSDFAPHICNIGFQSYYVPHWEVDFFSDKQFEAYRLGEVRNKNMNASEPVIRDSDLMAISMDAVRFSDAPAASNPSPNGFSGEEICQLAYFAGLSNKCKSLGLFDMIPQNDCQDMTAMLAAQIAWYFIEGTKKRNIDNPKDDMQNFKKYLIFFDELHYDLCFFKNIKTERWWMKVPSITNDEDSLIISCLPEDYLKATEQEIPDRWWKTYQRIN